MATPDQFSAPKRITADRTILENLTSYRRTYGDAHKFEEEEWAQTDMIRAQFLSPEVVRERLSDLQEQGNRGKFEIFDYQGTFNPETQCYELKKKARQYSEDNPNRNNRFMFKRLRILIRTLLKHLEENLEKGRVHHLSMTALKYKVEAGYDSEYESEFKSSHTLRRSSRTGKKQKRTYPVLVYEDLLRICSTLECTRDSLRVYIEQAGAFAGDISFEIGNQKMSGLDKIPGGMAGQPVPTTGLGTMRNVVIGDDITCLLIIENHALFSIMWELGYHTSYKCILVNLSGHPDLLVREFICRITAVDWTLPVFCLCDLDVGGYLIAEGLKFGTRHSAFMHRYSCCKRLQWMGIQPSDIASYELQPNYYSDGLFSDADCRKLRAHMATFSQIPLHWKEELKKMMELPRKVKLQGDGIVDGYLLCKLEDVAHWGEP